MRCTNNANICSAQEETRSKKENKCPLIPKQSSDEKLKKRIKRVTSTNTSWIMEEKKKITLHKLQIGYTYISAKCNRTYARPD